MKKSPAFPESFLTHTPLTDSRAKVELVLPDRVGVLSIVTGVFACHRLNIESCSSQHSGKLVRESFEVYFSKAPNWKTIQAEIGRFVAEMTRGELGKVQSAIMERLVRVLRQNATAVPEKLRPVEMTLSRSKGSTLLEIRSQDTPLFLYSLSNALALMNINITRIEATTTHQKIHDRLWLATDKGEPIVSRDKLRQIQWAVLLIKQMTHQLYRVPDPKAVLEQIMILGKTVWNRTDFDRTLLRLKKTEALENFGQAFGSSPYLWEEFIRLQSPALVDLLGNEALLAKRKTHAIFAKELQARIKKSKTFQDKIEALNAYKDNELFRIDLRHLLRKTSYLGEFAEEFSALAEAVIASARTLALDEARRKIKFKPAAKAPAEDAILALGKFGGKELGYASDLELMFVYREDADSQSEAAQKKFFFFEEYVRTFNTIIRSRTEGVFEIDPRLRPYGKDGPLIVSSALFEKYYSNEGEARNFERQALIKMRPIVGSKSLITEIMRKRDEFVFSGKPFDFKEALELRERQRNELVRPGEINAKYSAGGLIDVEYLVQTLQIIHGKQNPSVRTPNTLEAIKALAKAGALNPKDAEDLRDAYLYLRDLINALRIVRGNAKDLTIHDVTSAEYAILARRLGYQGTDEAVRHGLELQNRHAMQIAHDLYEDIMLRFANEKQVASKILKKSKLQKVSAPDSRNEWTAEALRGLGFENTADSEVILSRLFKAYGGEFKAIMNKHRDVWNSVADPDLALFHLELFLTNYPDARRIWSDVEQNRTAWEYLLKLFGSSRYLSQILLDHVAYWNWLKDPRQCDLAVTLRNVSAQLKETPDLKKLQELRRVETLRIALNEMLGLGSLKDIYMTFSRLAECILEQALRLCDLDREVCVMGLGKLGGDELNFSSDIDILFVQNAGSSYEQVAPKLQEWTSMIQGRQPSALLYRVDLRLRPHGDNGTLCMNLEEYADYYATTADAWEFQALLKARPVAGLLELGEQWVQKMRPFVYRKSWDIKFRNRWIEVKKLYETEIARRGHTFTDIKLGLGGIRDAEFSVQSFQLIHGHKYLALQNPRTLEVLEVLVKDKYLSSNDAQIIRESYIFLRRIENRIQLYDNRQVLNIPDDKRALFCLARSLGICDEAGETADEVFLKKLKQVREACRQIFEKTFMTLDRS